MRTLLIAALLLLTLFPCYSQTQPTGKFAHLKKYAAELPVDETVRPRRNLLATQELKIPLLKLLGRQNYQRLLESYDLMLPIEIINVEFERGRGATMLIMKSRSKERAETALLLVDLDSADGALYVAFGNDEGRSEWFSTRGDHTGLPQEIKERLSW